MDKPLHIALVEPKELDVSDLVADLVARDVRVSVYDDLRAAYDAAKADAPDALIYCSGRANPIAASSPLLRRYRRECASALLYIVSRSTTECLTLLADDAVEGFFSTPPSGEHLATVVNRARSVRAAQSARNTPRYDTRLACMVKVVGIGKLAEGEVRQIGRNGFKAMLRQAPFEDVTHEPIRFTLFDSVTGKPARIEGFGEIRWSDTRSAGQGAVEMGVQFTDLPAPSRDGLLSIINELRTTVA